MYCKYCGNYLDDGQICTCEEARKEAQLAQDAATATAEKKADESPLAGIRKQVSGDLKSILRNYFKSPVQAVDETVNEGNFRIAVILNFACMLGVGLSLYGIFNRLKVLLLDTIKRQIPYAQNLGMPIDSFVTVKSGDFLLWGAVIAIFCIALVDILTYGLNRASKGSASLKNIHIGNTVNSIPTITLLIASFCLSFVSVPATMILLAVACFVWVVFGTVTAQYFSSENTSGKFWILYAAGVLLIFAICWKVVPGLLWNAVKTIEVYDIGEKVYMTLESAKDSLKEELEREGIPTSFSGLIEGLTENIW